MYNFGIDGFIKCVIRLVVMIHDCFIVPKPSHIVLNFLDECCKIRVSMHLHSFTYDYHLKSLEWYIIGQPSYLPRDYHLTSFLDDFLKYYPKAPNFASSLLYMNNLVGSNLSTSPSQLYDFLLGHEKDYGMDVLRMIPNDSASRCNIYKTTQENEFVLVRHEADIFRNHSLKQFHEPFNNFNITLIIACDKGSNSKIKLNYYIVLTCSRDFKKKDELELRRGKFFTVTTGNKLELDVIINKVKSEYSAGLGSEASPDLPEHIEIRQESVHYLGYYSFQEQTLLRIMLTQATIIRDEIEYMVNKGSIDCRIHLLWNKLLSNSPQNALSYSGLFELKSLAHTETFIEVDQSLLAMLHQPFPWYQGLMKILSNKYTVDKFKMFTSPDNTTHHLLIIHPRFLDGFVMLTLDLSVFHGELSIIFRQTDQQKRDLESESIHSLCEGVINACCFHLWVSLLCN